MLKEKIETFKKKKSIKKLILVIVLLYTFFTGFYFWLCYTDVDFVKKWRTIYVETAMSTMTHQWLATAFLPDDVVNSVVENNNNIMNENIIDESEFAVPSIDSTFDLLVNESMSRNTYSDEYINKILFEKNYPEIDMETMPDDIVYTDLQISDIVDLGIKTNQGDSVWAIDTINKLLILEVKGNNYVGKLAIVKDSSNVYLKTCARRDLGQTVTELCEVEGAVLGINSCGFADPNGMGSGGTPIGYLKANGEVRNYNRIDGYFQYCGFDDNNNFRVGKSLPLDSMRDVVQFFPIVVLEGEKYADGSYGLGIQPRTVIGQNTKKETLMLIIDGRQVGYSIGATIGECADIMLRYGAFNAMNLDGGSSSSMTYMGKMITKTSSPGKAGRLVPAAFIVKPPNTAE